MARATPPPDSLPSVWDVEPDDAPAMPSMWQRLGAAMASLRHRADSLDLAANPSDAQGAALTTGGRGRALREAHRVLRRQLRSHRTLADALPHLVCIEQTLAHQGSPALQELPLGLLRRGLLQLGRLPWDDPPETARPALHTLRLRLIEAIEQRSLRPVPPDSVLLAPDSFQGSIDSQLSSLPPAGVVVDDLSDTDLSASELAAWPPQAGSGRTADRAAGRRKP